MKLSKRQYISMTKVLGFDISSSTIGYAVLDINDNKISLLEANFIKPSSKGSIVDRLIETRDKINKIILKHNPDHIAIEDIIKFMKGHSTAQTIITLTSFNRMVCLCSFDAAKKKPELFSIMTIRHTLRRAANIKKAPKKEEIPQLLESILQIKFPWVVDKKGKIKKESYDVSDAIACAYCLANKLTKS